MVHKSPIHNNNYGGAFRIHPLKTPNQAMRLLDHEGGVFFLGVVGCLGSFVYFHNNYR